MMMIGSHKVRVLNRATGKRLQGAVVTVKTAEGGKVIDTCKTGFGGSAGKALFESIPTDVDHIVFAEGRLIRSFHLGGDTGERRVIEATN